MVQPLPHSRLLLAPHPLLNTALADAQDVTPGLVASGASMLVSLDDFDAVGLAANQVGLAARFFVHRAEGAGQVVINPHLLDASFDDQEKAWEGCLSLPGQPCPVARPRALVLAYVGPGGAYHEVAAQCCHARVPAHELDHLDGVLISKRARRPWCANAEG
jgi:peptide deformylase